MAVTEIKRSNNMLFSIERKRNEMILTGKKTGLTSKETLKHSMELDKLIYSYQIQLKRNVLE